jgi:hypothetical protein
MNTKHTPGPWEVRSQGDANEYCVITAGGKWLFALRHNGEQWTAEQLANAQLIAAAPKLLQALLKLEASMSAILESDPRRTGPAALIAGWLDEVRAAITTTAGEQA